ncbi:MAG: hypothetical protein ACYSU1_05155 [Planctomycetota bacterium]|jgi:hypothetical protein
MKRKLLAVVLGYLIWTGLWLGGNALLFADLADQVEAGAVLTDVGPLVGVLGLSVVCSLVAGGLVGKLASCAGKTPTVLGILLLATGLFVQWGVWDLMPLWYHLVFLVLLLPMVRIGAVLTGGG